jgi:hypothetical protein
MGKPNPLKAQAVPAGTHHNRKERGVPPCLQTRPAEALTHPPPGADVPPWSPKALGEIASTARRRWWPACAPAPLDHPSETLRGLSLGKAQVYDVARELSPAARTHSSSTRC